MTKKWAIAVAIIAYFSLSSAAHSNPRASRQADELEIDRQIIERSPVLRRWLEKPPDLLEDIHNTPSFDKKFRIGITSRNNSLGLEAGFEDLFVGQSSWAVSGSYQTEFSGRESEIQANFRYYLLPLGSYWNISPIVGYRQFNQWERPQTSGLDVGLLGILVLSPHSSDLRLSHTFTSPNGNLEMSTTVLSTSYAITNNFRLGTKIEWRRSPLIYDSRVGFLLELAL
ncbi:hypothetical protein H6F42_14390 [Pseudanabaena sp. FACHB-1998]|uniref:hypothetical protein n=1 Tax=Pseudanabaena sp. FACHB-1998 TaxID=2692858 RepID=UPI0016814080|nr:hypothetical protein [Pseudanabaena sp. FACHB-1998]MBD2178107.1 hypothetical protein [Pseudanabaena sp. FACHB-1998]